MQVVAKTELRRRRFSMRISWISTPTVYVCHSLKTVFRVFNTRAEQLEPIVEVSVLFLLFVKLGVVPMYKQSSLLVLREDFFTENSKHFLWRKFGIVLKIVLVNK